MKHFEWGEYKMNFNDLLPVGLTIIAVVVALGIGASVLATIDAQQSAGSVAKNITGTGMASLKGLVTWLPTIALVVAMAIIIGLIVNAFRV